MMVAKYKVCPYDGQSKCLGDNRDDEDYNDCIGCSYYSHCNVVEVKIVSGYGKEVADRKEQDRFLADFKSTLKDFGLPVNSIVSERPTGGPITLMVPDHVEYSNITKAFLSFATALARQEQAEVKFDLILPGCSSPITILGTRW